MNKLISISNTILSNNTGLDAITRAPIVEYVTPYRCLRIQNVSHEENFEEWGYTEVSKDNYINFQLHKDDIIISRTGGSIGTLMYIDKDYPAVYNNGLIRLVVNKEKYNPLYIYYCLKLNAFNKHIEKCSLGNSTQENIRMNDMLEYKIPNYSLDIQDKIVSILNVLDRRINNNKIINAELEAMAKIIYDYWFLQFDFPDENGKPYKSSGGKMVWNDEMKKEIPEGWEVIQLKEICSFVKGKIPDKLVDIENDTNYASYITIEVANGRKAQFCSKSKMPFCNGEVIMVMDGAASGDIYVGNVGVLGSTFAMLSLKDNRFSDALIYCILNSQKEIYKKANTGSTIPHANRKFIENMKVLMPKNVKFFSEIFSQIYDEIAIKKKENQELAALRDFLLPLLMNGQVGFK